jgi:hypothetical protein
MLAKIVTYVQVSIGAYQGHYCLYKQECIGVVFTLDHFHVQNLPEDEVLRHGKEAVEAHFKSKFKEVNAVHHITLT